MLPTADTTRFTLIASRENGLGIQGATVRVLTQAGVDVSAYLFKSVDAITDVSGTFSATIQPFFVPSAYTIQVVKAGYNLASIASPAQWFGYGEFATTLIRTSAGTSGYSLIGYGGAFRSPVLPLMVGAESTADADWERIKFTISQTNSHTAKVGARVKPDGTATTDLRALVELPPRPNLVPDGQTLLVDPDFSDVVTVSASSLTDDGELPISVGLSYYVANIIPTPGETELDSYANGKWVTLLPEPVIFRGYYFDAMIWLPYLTEGNSASLKMQYLDGAYLPVGAAVTTPMPIDKQIYRVRPDAQPDGNVAHVRLWIEGDAGEIISEILTCHYRA